MNINPAIRKDDLGKFACRNEACSLHALRGRGNIRVVGWSGRRKRFRQLACHRCGVTFSENYGTPFYGIKSDREKVAQALKMVVERGSIRGAARAVGVDKDTIVDWIKKASLHSEAFAEYMLHDLRMTAVELDELWTTVKKNKSILAKRTKTRETRTR